MSTVTKLSPPAPDWTARARDLGQRFAARAAEADAGDRFVAANFADLKAAGLLAAGVPAELGGGGAGPADLAAMLTELARHCGSTALSFSMHTHQVAMAAWRWRHQGAPVEPLLRRVAAENIVLLSSGGSDWLAASGTATRADGGYRIDARKIFASGAPAGDLLLTSAVLGDPDKGNEVLHFAVPMNSPAVRVLDTWRAMGMRGTGSHDIEITGFFLPEAAVAGRRPQGKWHPLFHIVSMIALPLIYSVYLGVAEAARGRALAMAERRKGDPGLPYVVGEMERQLLAARLAHRHMLDCAATDDPGPGTTNAVLAGRSLVATAVLATVDKALEVAGGVAFYRDQTLERLFRDLQAARFHPLPDKAQARLAGRYALGLPLDD